MKDSKGRNPLAGKHAYNTWSRTSINIPGASSSSTPSKDNNNPQPVKQIQPIKQTQPVKNSQPF